MERIESMIKPETIENRWDILYRDYPEVYDEFARVKAVPAKDFGEMLGVKGKTVVDVACGTGKSTFAFARYAARVIGIEPEEAMIEIARENLKKEGFSNVVFQKGTTDQMPLPDHSVDVVAAVTSASFYNAENIERFVKESERILVKGGAIFSIDSAPGWYGGELAPIILGPSRRTKPVDYDFARDEAFKALGFQYKDFYTTRYYDSLEHILSTYGFIFGKKAIEYIKEHNKTTIRFKGRIYSRQI
jgi:ubiquinone/menaquinone biosynthesis C-methylase UbiE